MVTSDPITDRGMILSKRLPWTFTAAPIHTLFSDHLAFLHDPMAVRHLCDVLGNLRVASDAFAVAAEVVEVAGVNRQRVNISHAMRVHAWIFA